MDPIRRVVLTVIMVLMVVFMRWPASDVVDIKRKNYLASSRDCEKTIQISGGQFKFTLPPADKFTDGCKIFVRNGDDWTGRGKLLVGFPAGFTNGKQILWPNQVGAIQAINRKWVTLVRPGRPELPDGRVNFWSDYELGSDTLTDCMAPGKDACKTANHALHLPCGEFDFSASDTAQTRFYVNMAPYVIDRSWVHYACPSIPGGNGGAQLVLAGGAGSQIGVQGIDAVGVVVNAMLTIHGVHISTDTGRCLHSDFGGTIFFVGGTFGDCPFAVMAARNNGRVYIQSHYKIYGKAGRHLYRSSGGVISVDPPGFPLFVTLGKNADVLNLAEEMQDDTLSLPDPVSDTDAFLISTRN